MTTLNLSVKFAKELSKFFTWANEHNYYLRNNDTIIQWSEDILPEFVEPSRNKIDTYIKEIMEKYEVFDKNDLKIEKTYSKLFTKEFKENKPTTKASKTSKTKTLKTSETSETSIVPDEIQNDNRQPRETNTKTETNEPKKRKYTKRATKEQDTSSTIPDNFYIELKGSQLTMFHDQWKVETLNNATVIDVIEYIAKNKDNIISIIKQQQQQSKQQSESEQQSEPEQKTIKKTTKKSKVVEKEKEDVKTEKNKSKNVKVTESIENEQETIKVNEQETIKVNEKKKDKEIKKPKIDLKVDTNFSKSWEETYVPGSPDLADDFGQINLDDIEF